MNLKPYLLISAILLSASLSPAGNRLLLPPPENYRGLQIGAITYVVGIVLIPTLADTSILEDYGFRAFIPCGSFFRSKKIRALWPINTDLKSLPDAVQGLSYEDFTPDDLQLASILPAYEFKEAVSKRASELRFAEMLPADGEPNLYHRDRPYVRGTIYFSSTPDEDRLDELGIILFNYVGCDDPAYQLNGKCDGWSAIWPMDISPSTIPVNVSGMCAEQTDFRPSVSRSYYSRRPNGAAYGNNYGTSYSYSGYGSCYSYGTYPIYSSSSYGTPICGTQSRTRCNSNSGSCGIAIDPYCPWDSGEYCTQSYTTLRPSAFDVMCGSPFIKNHRGR